MAGNEVVLIGDSYFQIPGNLPTRLNSDAQAAGAPQPYTDRAVSGTRMAAIAGQYQTAEAGTPKVKVLIMDGGGNDILQTNGCSANPATCTAITDAANTLKQLFQQVATDGTVQQIIYFFYPDLTPIGVNAEATMRPLMQAACQASTVPCHFLDLRPTFMGHPEFTGPDNLHPSMAGANATADAIWSVMQQNCIAQ